MAAAAIRKYKTGLEGDSGVGKTSFVERLVSGRFNGDYEPTIQASFQTKKDKDLAVELELWDSAGRERFAAIAPMKYRQAAGVFFVFDLTEKRSFDALGRYVKAVAASRVREKPDQMVAVILGNKLDLVAADPDKRCANQTAVDALIEKELRPIFGDVLYFEISCKTGEGVEKSFQAVVQSLDKLGLQPQTAKKTEASSEWWDACSIA